MSAERLIRAAASAHDDDGGVLADGALRLLERLTASSGKTCPKCGVRRPLSSFGRDARETVGLSRLCRRCIAVRDAARPTARSSAGAV